MNRIEKVRLSLDSCGIDAMMVTSGDNRFYTTSFRSSAGVALIGKDFAVFMTDFRYREAAERALDGYTLEMTKAGHSYADVINEYCQRYHVKTIGFEGSMTFNEHAGYAKNVKAELVECGSLLHELRRVKEPDELDALREAQVITDKVFAGLLEYIRPGVTELDINDELNRLFRVHGITGQSFTPIIVSGENGSLCHGRPTQRVVQKGEFVTMDFGCVLNGYCSDMTRTVAVGEPTEEMKKVYNVVLEAQLAALAYARPGVVGREMDGVARKVIADAGYGEYFGHGLGHGLGILGHDTDGCSPSNERTLPEYTVTTVEPGIYIPGKFGVRIEDSIILVGDGHENMTKSPKELIIL
ncbi:MAG: aminopeptidase P family protein [Clostridia bacterium]|nr:aminopeptidase P family protein [Oscillospiraceae bacterium]MBR6748650.1 aminopeptidase P family protein [Clostridia bacterium]